MIINANELLRSLNKKENIFTHKKVVDILSGVKGKASKNEIQLVKNEVNIQMKDVVNKLSKLERE